MAAPGPATVFVSYAREDADAARRIAEALRAFGIEVWFDQAELRGGDAWDAKIRKQIRECALFMPIISARTQERHEGYFRREWKLGVERTHDLAAGVAFVVPVVIDDTRENEAAVPEEFMRVQWTRLPHAVPSPEFVQQVQRLLSTPRKAPPARGAGATGGRLTTEDKGKPAETGPQASPAPGTRKAKWAVAAAAIAAVGLAGFFALRPSAKDIADASSASRGGTGSPPTAATADKSVAVLPFANLSDDRDANAFFADGIHEDILTNLALIRELRVISRTSVEQYRGTKKTMRQIGDELRAAYILEGSVRRAGNTVRVTGQLIHAGTDEHVWAKSYDRELKDVFAIQAALAQEIAGALRTAISPAEQKLLERRPTENVAAYDLYLKARELLRAPAGAATAERQITLLQAAVELDPNFAAAWARLCFCHGWIYFFDRDHTAARVARARTAMETAVRLAPESPEAMHAVGDYHYYCLRDFAGAAAQYLNVERRYPSSAHAHSLLSAVYRRMGRWTDAVAAARRIEQIDPGDLLTADTMVYTLQNGRRYDEARATQQRIAHARPANVSARFMLAQLSFLQSGSVHEVNQVFAGLSPTQASSFAGFHLRKLWAIQSGNLAESLALNESTLEPTGPDSDDIGGPMIFEGTFARNRELVAAVILTAKNEMTEAVRAALGARAKALRTRLETQPENSSWLVELGQMEGVLGEKHAALRHARKAVELCPEKIDAAFGPVRSAGLAFVYAWTGDKDRAIAEYARLLRIPSPLNVHVMKRDPQFFPLQGDPRFQALLNDPKNNAPLF